MKFKDSDPLIGANPALRFDGVTWRSRAKLCVQGFHGLPQGGAIGGRWFRQILTGLSPTGKIGSRIAADGLAMPGR